MPRPHPARWIVLTVLTALALVLPLTAPVQAAAQAPLGAPPARCGAPGVQTFGPATTTGAIVGAVLHGGRGYVVTRGLKPPIVAEFDLVTRKVVRSVPLPDGPADGEAEGAWAMTVSGGKVYIGTYPVPDLYRFDPATGEVEHLHSFGRKGGFVWSLATAPDGTIYAGTYSDGRVWEYSPATGAVRNFGVLAAGERYVRSIAVDADNVYAGLLDKGRLMAIGRADGAVRDITPAALGAKPAGFGVLADYGDRLLAGSGTFLVDVRKDGSDARVLDLGAVSLDAITVAADGTAYLSSRPYGSIYRYRTGDTALTEVGTPPSPGDEHRALALTDEHTLVGFAGSGGVWSMDLRTGRSEFTELLDAGIPAGPERPQSILLDPRKAVYVAGHWAVEVRDLRTGAHRRIRVPGEPKAMLLRNHKIYAALYPSGQIIELDPRNDRIRSLGYLGNGQKRPWDMEYDRRSGLLLIASAPLGADLSGALTLLDPDTGKMDVYHDVVPDQSLMSLTVDGGIAYLGADVLGGGGTPPTQSAASVAAFDLRTRKVLWQVTPVPGNRTIQDVIVHRGLLYGVFKRNAGWFVMDLATRTVIRQGPLTGYGELYVHRGKVFASTYFGGGNVHQLGPDLAEPKLVATGLGDEWYTNPQLAFEPNSWNAWTLVGRDLALVRLDPGCPALDVTP
ncbi:PQQ-binding-like beta-propeller repeat protein [Streptosporangium roseum]|uniref:outer membrane protein assembly factor BamB family protein n=1 Tax=Streptosporangium roseum TaxID=2001 RepID=UPI000690ED5F|nr:PQQ-binding-like beta-propeller repeat protein [Streptosporangium roseum]